MNRAYGSRALVIRLLTIIFVFATLETLCDSNTDKFSINPWDLPVVPSSIPSYPNISVHDIINSTIYKKKIPRLMWVGYRVAPKEGEKISHHMNLMSEMNPLWKVHRWGHNEKDQFMEEYFANTSVLWALKLANPAIGVSHADIWRYCVLWAFGGYYSDDDSYIGIPLDTIIKEEDSMIITPEKGISSDCYQPHYRLSRTSVNAINVNHSSLLAPYRRPIVIWGIFSEPGSPVLENALRNVVEIFKFEYLKRSVINIARHQSRATNVFCSTGPVFFLSSLRQFVATNPQSPFLPRLTKKPEFLEYKAIGKIYDDEVSSTDHYANKIARYNLKLLHSYSPVTCSLEYLEGRYVAVELVRNVSDGSTDMRNSSINNGSHVLEMPLGGKGMGLYLVANGRLLVYPDYCTFLGAYSDSRWGPSDQGLEIVDRNTLHNLFNYNQVGQNTSDQQSAQVQISTVISSASHSSSQSQGNPLVTLAPSTPFTRVVTSDKHTYYLVKGCARYGFPDPDTFNAMGYSFSNVTVISMPLLNALPYQGLLPKLDF